jgi:hypothetical protein
MDEGALIRRNRWLLAHAAEVRATAREALITVEYGRHVVELNRVVQRELLADLKQRVAAATNRRR